MKWFDYLIFSMVLLGFVVGTVVGNDQAPVTEAFTFAQLGDPQLGWRGYEHDVTMFKKTVRLVNALKPDFAVIVGDMVNSFNDSSVKDFKDMAADFTIPYYCVPGNHDIGNDPTVSRLVSYRKAFGKDYFSFEHKGYTFVFANTSLWKVYVQGESETHDAWFKETLEAARDKNTPIFVVQHYALYKETPTDAEGYYTLPVDKRNELLALYEDCGVIAVLNGHFHETIMNEYKGILLVSGEGSCGHFDTRPLGFRIWHVESPTSLSHEFFPLELGFDFNNDEIIDSADMSLMIDHWGQDYAFYDIAPPPIGDGIIDVQDLILLSEHLFEDYRLMAHWKLDETEGDIAYDNSVGSANGTLNGSPTWQPADGQSGGALLFDGIDDYISTSSIFNPSLTPFSIYAWIKGGAPGQVAISQTGSPWGSNLLGFTASDGSLVTELKGKSRWDRPLVSGSIVTDGDWHHIGLVWDGTNRVLYVDDVEVIADTQAELGSTYGGLNIGASEALDAGKFFSGLIDDVKIYNRAVTP